MNEVRPRKDKRGVELISDVTKFKTVKFLKFAIFSAMLSMQVTAAQNNTTASRDAAAISFSNKIHQKVKNCKTADHHRYWQGVSGHPSRS
jgi:hypothetical protein